VSRSSTEVCCLCGAESREDIAIRGVGRICPDCLMAGRFLGTPAGMRLSEVAQRVIDLSATAENLLRDVLGNAEQMANDQQYDAARDHFLNISHKFMDQNRPLLAANVLYRALRLPGQSAEVYAALGTAAQMMNCTREAIQHLKTASWLAIQSGNRPLMDRILEQLQPLAPQDGWAQKARQRVEQQEGREEMRCGFCGRTAAEAGPLITGSEAAICSGCVKKLMLLDGKTH
jgi:hypothetical protein